MKTYYCHIETPVGPVLLVGSDESLTRISFAQTKHPTLPNGNWIRDWSMLAYAIKPIERYFLDGRVIDIQHTITGTAFQLSVWNHLRTIPVGQITTYGEVARAIGHRHASQSVANACALNPLALLIPCHRVVSAEGAVSGFSGGLKVQHGLLRHEGVQTMEDQLDLFE